MDLVKVFVATEWQFARPLEIIRSFQQTRVGQGLRIEYELQNHFFVIECQVQDTHAVTLELQSILRTYVSEEGLKNNSQNDVSTLPGIVTIADTDICDLEQKQIWDTVDELEALDNETSDCHQLIQQNMTDKVMRLSSQELQKAFAAQSVKAIEKVTGCTVSVFPLTQTISVKGWSEEEVTRAIELLEFEEERWIAALKRNDFDFVNEENWQNATLRLVRPTQILDLKLCAKESPPLCEVVMVTWDTASHQHKLVRKQPTCISPLSPGPTLWTAPMSFNQARERFEPLHTRAAAGLENPVQQKFGYLSPPQVARTRLWAKQVAEQPCDPNTTSDECGTVDPVPSLAASEANLGTKRIRKRRGNAEGLASSVAAGTLVMSRSELGLRDENVLEDDFQEPPDRENNDTKLAGFGLLKAPQRTLSLLGDCKQGPLVRKAITRILSTALPYHESALAFELHIGRVLVHSISVVREDLRPKARLPAKAFQAEESWQEIFRMKECEGGASTVFSHKLTTSWVDAEFLVQVHLKGGEPLFDHQPTHRRCLFEIACRERRTAIEAIIEIQNDGTETLAGSIQSLGSVNFHHPARTWDCRWQLSLQQLEFPPEQEKKFRGLIDCAYVVNPRSSSEEAMLVSRCDSSLELSSVRLVKESVHLAAQGLRLCLRQTRILEVETLSGEEFKAFSPGAQDQAIDESRTWWEAKIVSERVQQALRENRTMPIGSYANWEPQAIAKELEAMLPLASHLISKIDDVGAKPLQARASPPATALQVSR